MMSYLSLVPISARVHKRQSRMTRICIILAVFLVTSIFSLLEMWMDGQTTAMRSKHGDWHIALQNMTEDKAEQIIDGSDVKYSSWFDAVNADADSGYYISGKTAVLYGVEEAYGGFGDNEEHFRAFLKDAVAASSFRSGIDPESVERVLMLSTCSNVRTDMRYAVIGAMEKIEE